MTLSKKELSEYMRKLGSKGGSTRSKAKSDAARELMKKINSRKRKKKIGK